MKLQFEVELQEMTNGMCVFKFAVFFKLTIDNQIIFDNVDIYKAKTKIKNLPCDPDKKDKIEEHLYKSMDESIRKYYRNDKYSYTI